MVVAMLPFGLIIVVTDYQRERVSLFLDPTQRPAGLRLQHPPGRDQRSAPAACFGKGLTHGTQTQLDYLRTQTTDYIFSVLGEELGFVGALLLFGAVHPAAMARPARRHNLAATISAAPSRSAS